MNGLAFAGQEETARSPSYGAEAFPATDGGPRVIVDLTDVLAQLADGQLLTGIPRVVLQFANAAPALARRHGISLRFGYFDQVASHFVELQETDRGHPSPEAGSLQWLTGADGVALANARMINFPKIHAKYAGKPIRRRLQLAKGKLRLAHRRIIRNIRTNFTGGVRRRPLQFQPNDVFLMLGSGWNALPLLDYIRPFASSGLIRPVILVHDVIPLLDLGEPPPVPAAIFRQWLDQAAELTQDFLTYSVATRNDLLKYFETSGRTSPNVEVVPLAHELTIDRRTALSRPIRNLIRSRYSLFVGPTHGRKNALRLLEAWRIVLSRLGPELTPILAITDGASASRIEATHIRPIESHVRLLDRPGDFELSVLYRRAAFTVFPSLYEGWGLPVGESLWHGTPCITSNLSAMPEVGGTLCDYVDPLSVESIAKAVQRLASDERYRNQRAQLIKGNKFRCWNGFAEGVLTFAARRQQEQRHACSQRH
ncbi:MAG: glycosyltransferase family 4 protein [Rhodomicrobiaceae bacterium]